MWRTGLITILLCVVVKGHGSNVETPRTMLENVPMRALLVNETDLRRTLLEQEDYSGTDNDNDSSGSGSGLSNQLQMPDLIDSQDIADGYHALNSTKRLLSVSTSKDGGEVMDGDEQSQSKSGDWDFVLSGSGNQSDISTAVDEGHGRVADTPPVTHKSTMLGGGKWHSEPKKCEERQHHVKLVSTGGNTIVSSAEMVLHCTVHSPLNETVELVWYYPSWHNFSRMDLTESEEERKNEKVTLGVLRLRNVSESDSGVYRCEVLFRHQHRCNRNATANVTVYTPPSIATDVAIVLTVCFLELIIIIYFKTRSDKKCKSKGADRPSTSYKQLQLVQNKT